MMNQATMSVKTHPDDDVQPRGADNPRLDALFDDGRLQVELHPGRDGGADDADDHVHVGLVATGRSAGELDRGRDGGVVPAGLRQHAGEDIGDVDKRGDEENLFHALVLALDHDQPDKDGADGHGDESGQWNKCRLAAMPMNSVTRCRSW